MLLPDSNLNEFWDNALNKTEGFNTAALLKKQFSCFAQGERIVIGIITRLCKNSHPSSTSSPRVYVDDRPVSHQTFSTENTPLPGESLQHWGARCFGGQRFCVVLTQISPYSEDYTRAVAELLQPLLPKLEPLICPYPFIAAGFFLGSYDKTPFGIHIDKPELKSVLHIHLGPGTKRMTVWPASHPEFSGIKNIRNNIEGHLKTGETYTIEPGDAFFLPAGSHHHIGENQSLSLGLTVGINDSRNNQRKALKQLMKAPQQINTLSNYERQHELQELIYNQELERLSNSHLPACFKRDKSHSFDLQGTLQRTAPFKIYLRATQKQNASFIYARGQQLKNTASLVASDLIDRINSDQKINAQSWLNQCVTPQERTTQEAIIRELVALNAITLK